ncbi:MAG: hypothetical protein V1875_05835 [Candidatus Altiarchaeota archaeon]
MFPYEKRDKQIRRPSLFGDFDQFFAGFEDFDKYTEQLFKAAQEGKAQSYVYGYRAYTGEDGKPVIEEFSNMPEYAGRLGGGEADERLALPQPRQEKTAPSACAVPCADCSGDSDEPYYDVVLDGDRIKAIVELPGVDEKDIKVAAKGRNISVEAGGYSAKIKAPAHLKEKPDKTTYKNGVLELTYSKAKNQKDPAVV